MKRGAILGLLAAFGFALETQGEDIVTVELNGKTHNVAWSNNLTLTNAILITGEILVLGEDKILVMRNGASRVFSIRNIVVRHGADPKVLPGDRIRIVRD